MNHFSPDGFEKMTKAGHPSPSAAPTEHQLLIEAGLIARQFAHDFNNQLTVIIGCTDLALRVPGQSPETIQLLAQIKQAGERAKQLVQPLREFNRPATPGCEPFFPPQPTPISETATP